MKCMFDDDNMNFTLEIKEFEREVTIEMIEKELSLIKAWRKSDIRFKKRIEK